MSTIKILHILGIDDSDKIGVLFLSHDPTRMCFNFMGNVQLLPFLNRSDFEIFPFFVGSMKGDPITLPKMNIAFNAICDPDSNYKSLSVASKIIDSLKIPVFNHPQDILKTGRDKIYETFQTLPGTLVPKTIRFQPRYISDLLKMIESGQISPPFLVRQAGSHAGLNLELIEDMKNIHDLEKFAFDGRDYYVTCFIDYRSNDGLFKKYRVVVVGGVPLPRHLVIADSWNVHGESGKKLMDDHPEYQLEEETFLKEFRKRDPGIFHQMYEQLNLDYFGVDFSYAPDGKMIIFEINSCFRIIGVGEVKDDHHYPYIDPYVENIKTAVADLIRKKVKSFI